MARLPRILPVTAGSPSFHSVDVGALRVSDTRFPPRLRLEPHSHERTSFGVILEGNLDVLFGTRTHTCREGTVESKPPGERHANRFGAAGARVLVVEPSPDAMELLRPAARFLDASHCFLDPVAVMLAWRLAAELQLHDELVHMAVEGLALELLAQCARRTAGTLARAAPPRWLLEARDLLMDSFRKPLRIGFVAAAVGVHPAYLARRFRACFGTTMAAFVRSRRVEWAIRCLMESDDSIASVAVQAGFADQSSLTRSMRQHTGTTPLNVRRQSRAVHDRPEA